MAPSKSWFTLEDCKMAFNLFCCVYGVGTLGMPGNFSRAGPFLAVCAMVFMALANIYASVVCSKVMLIAPSEVKTFGDLGEWCMGKWGRWIIVVSHTMVCVSIPCLYFVLGGTFLPSLFPDTFSDVTWIIFMALMQTPICLTPTLKEGAGAALAGCLGTILADIVGMAVLFHGMEGHGSVPEPNISVDQVATTFGNLSLGYAASVIIPALQRQHSQPERMPRVIWVTLTVVSVFFMTLASTGYSVIGCQIKGNLLFSIFPDKETGLAFLGFRPNKGWAVMAFLFMQLHISIAFAVFLHPAFYVFERAFLGMHKQKKNDDLEAMQYKASHTPGSEEAKIIRLSKNSVVSVADLNREHDDEYDEAMEYHGQAYKYMPMRILVIVALTVIAILLKNKFSDLADFIGASCISISCMIMPIVFYFLKLWKEIPMWEKGFGTLVIVSSIILGTYVTYTTGKALFTPEETHPDDPVFKFCHPEHQYELYYNATAAHGQ